MVNFFNNGRIFFLINCQSSYILYINIHLEIKIVDLKTGFLRIFLWRFIEVKRTITSGEKVIKTLMSGVDPEGAHPSRAPLKLEKKMIFWRKIVIFHTKYPKNFRASLRSARFHLSAPPLTWNPGSSPVCCLIFVYVTCL